MQAEAKTQQSVLVKVQNIGKYFDVSAPLLNRLIERKPKLF